MGQGNNNSLQTQLGNYTAPIPELVNMYDRNLRRGLVDQPSFQEMFESYRKLGEREAGRQSAAITEGFGSQGARYSSDLLGAQGRVRENLFDQLMNRASEYQLGLRQQQGQEVAAVSNLQYGANEAAMARFFQDFLRRTSPPPGYEQAYQMSGQYGLPPLIT